MKSLSVELIRTPPLRLAPRRNYSPVYRGGVRRRLGFAASLPRAALTRRVLTSRHSWHASVCNSKPDHSGCSVRPMTSKEPPHLGQTFPAAASRRGFAIWVMDDTPRCSVRHINDEYVYCSTTIRVRGGPAKAPQSSRWLARRGRAFEWRPRRWCPLWQALHADVAKSLPVRERVLAVLQRERHRLATSAR